jgi:hypothetical protein
MEMLGEDNEKLQKMVTPPWTFSFPKINASKCMPSTLGATFVFPFAMTWLLGGEPRFLFIFN